MSITDLHETLLIIARVPGEFYRDTDLLLNALDDIESISRRVKNIGHDPERRENKKPVAPENQKFDNY